MCSRRQEAEHPDDEEVVGDHGVHFRKANGLDANSRYELLVAEGVKQLGEDAGL